MNMKLRQSVASAAGFMAVMCVIFAAMLGEVLLAAAFRGEARVVSAVSEPRSCTVVIDAGHGGIDGGAVGSDGTLEKALNLAVAQRLAELCRLAGIDCVMTREDDRLVVDDSVTERRKMHDLKNRASLAEAQSNPIFVSIHMNNFPEPRYSGLQVWYSKHHELSKTLAATLQGSARTFLDASNSREIKAATSAIYLLDRLECPAILVECGFLSNPEECALLAAEEYQTRLAVVIFASIVEVMY